MTKIRVDDTLMANVQQLLARRATQPLPKGHVRPELKVTAQAEGQPAELLIYDEIGFWGIWAVDVAAALSTLSGPLHVRINSPGGDVFDGIAIYNMLADYPDTVTVTVDGLAASAASFIAQSGDHIVMNRASQMMIHDAAGGCRGHAADMKAMAALLDMISSTIAGIYASRAGGDANDWREAMLVDGGFGTWYTAEQAVAAGLADELVAAAVPDRDDDEELEPAARTAGLAALFPYGAADDRWRLAALASAPLAVPTSQASAPGEPRVPVAAPPSPPIAEADPALAPASSNEVVVEPSPAAEGTAGDHKPEGWADLTAHLTTPTSSTDEWESLKEALLR